jgi:1-phosphofructokinase family hexose kinase
MIITIVPNPSLDKTVVIPGFKKGHIHRPDEVLVLAGGKGCNFARALQRLGQSSKIIAPIGGYAGQYLLELAAREGLECEGPFIKTELRTCLTIIDPESADEPTEIYEQGARLEPETWEELITLVGHYLSEATFLAICGSFPPGVPEEGLVTLLRQANAAGLPVLLDTYGPQLLASLQHGPALLKINQQEAAEMTGYAITDPAGALEAAELLQKRGARQVVITLGKQGAVGLTAESEAFGWRAPVVASVYPTGSGDSFFAGVASGLAQGQHLSEAVRLGIAAGAANTLQIGAGRLELQQVEELLPQVTDNG